jgi:uncharacterized protein YdbL (DUF1318 family)
MRYGVKIQSAEVAMTNCRVPFAERLERAETLGQMLDIAAECDALTERLQSQVTELADALQAMLKTHADAYTVPADVNSANFMEYMNKCEREAYAVEQQARAALKKAGR